MHPHAIRSTPDLIAIESFAMQNGLKCKSAINRYDGTTRPTLVIFGKRGMSVQSFSQKIVSAIESRLGNDAAQAMRFACDNITLTQASMSNISGLLSKPRIVLEVRDNQLFAKPAHRNLSVTESNRGPDIFIGRDLNRSTVRLRTNQAQAQRIASSENPIPRHEHHHNSSGFFNFQPPIFNPVFDNEYSRSDQTQFPALREDIFIMGLERLNQEEPALCAITHERLQTFSDRAVMSQDGHIYDGDAIKKWIQLKADRSFDPLTKKPASIKHYGKFTQSQVRSILEFLK